MIVKGELFTYNSR